MPIHSIAGNALEALSKIDSAAALNEASRLSAQPAKGVLMDALIKFSDEGKFDSLAAKFDKLSFNSKFSMLQPFSDFLGRVKNTNNVKKGVDMIVKFRDTAPQEYHSFLDPFVNEALNKIAETKQAAGLTEQADYKIKIPCRTRAKEIIIALN